MSKVHDTLAEVQRTCVLKHSNKVNHLQFQRALIQIAQDECPATGGIPWAMVRDNGEGFFIYNWQDWYLVCDNHIQTLYKLIR